MRVLLTVSGVIPPTLADDIARGVRPRADYLEIAAALDADLIDHTAIPSPLRKLLDRVGATAVGFAIACFRRRKHYDVIFTDSEAVGMVYAALSLLVWRRPRHVMIAHRLSPPKKVLVHQLLSLRRRIDHVLVYATTQRDVAIKRLGYAPERVTVTPFMVDTAFWSSDAAPRRDRERPLISAAGQELRDYPTLAEAARDLDADVVLAAASPWSKRSNTAADLDIPPNVTVTSLPPDGLRQLYADSDVVAVPLEETDFQAGITTILEAMSMRRAIVCTRTTGQTDTIVDEVTGLYVPPGDVAAMRTAIGRLLADAALRERLATAARRWVEEHADIEVYAQRLADIVRRVGAG
jgi:glycosyltransferase involved in cell wall biosynthesis